VWTRTQRRYNMTELELLAILVAIKKWQYYLQGTTFTVRCYTDQTSLRMSQSDGLYSWVHDMINMNDGRLYDDDSNQCDR
jgi:hypothetical protein